MGKEILRRILTLALAISAVSGQLATAQAGTRSASADGKISGTVFDPQKAVVSDTKLLFESHELKREVFTNAEGNYEVELPAGAYVFTARKTGFCPFQSAPLLIEAGGSTSADVKLRICGIANVLHFKDGKYVGEECRLIDAETGVFVSPVSLKVPSTTLAQKLSTAPRSSARTITVKTQPGATVWVDDVRRGAADAEGKLELKLAPGRHALRVRASGFAERTLALLPTQRGATSVILVKTTDEAELSFQRAEEAREKGNNALAAEAYRQALKLRPRFAAAHLGLARALTSSEDFDAALEEVGEARRDRPAYAEASAVEGRILRSLADHDAALDSYRRAIREGRGFQPEAYAGMGIVHEDKGRNEEAVESFRKAIAQLSDTEPVLYELLARNLEKLERWKEAVAAYEKYLELAPTGVHASAINSIIDQLRRQAAEAEGQNPPD